jgi:hypothetical protein
MKSTTLLPTVIGLLLASFLTATAKTIQQADGENFVSFEAEHYKASSEGESNNNVVEWILTDDDASSGEAMRANFQRGQVMPINSKGAMVYELKFAEPGVYHLHARAMGPDGASDTAFIAQEWNVPVESDSYHFAGVPEGSQFVWIKGNPNAEWVIRETEEPVTFVVKIREGGILFDRFVFHKVKNVPAEELDELPNSPKN